MLAAAVAAAESSCSRHHRRHITAQPDSVQHQKVAGKTCISDESDLIGTVHRDRLTMT
jgi:hypothetical protein